MELFGSSPVISFFLRSVVNGLAGFLLLAFTCSYSFADKKISILFFASKSSDDYVEVLENIRTTLEQQSPEVYEFNTAFFTPEVNLKNHFLTADTIVTIGTLAAETVYSYKPKVPIISVLLTENAFLVLTKKYYGSVEEAHAAKVSSICLDQPVERSIHLAKLLIPDASEIGLMLGPASTFRQIELDKYVVAAGMHSRFVTISEKDNPIHKIEPVLSRSDIFIPVPDSRLINIATAKWILHLSYRHKVPVIAFSQSYLKAGALASIYSSPKNVAEDAAQWLINNSNVSLGKLYRPVYYSLKFNPSVAANLKITLKSEQFYRDHFNLGDR